MTNQIQTYRHILRMKAVPPKIGVGRSTVYGWLDPNSASYDPTFPKRILS
ncbi:AlpA family phage regulatory protein [Rhodoferax ferrireducens]